MKIHSRLKKNISQDPRCYFKLILHQMQGQGRQTLQILSSKASETITFIFKQQQIKTSRLLPFRKNSEIYTVDF